MNIGIVAIEDSAAAIDVGVVARNGSIATIMDTKAGVKGRRPGEEAEREDLGAELEAEDDREDALEGVADVLRNDALHRRAQPAVRSNSLG
eukprot:1989664-Rhodomonas_salina.2